MQKYILSVTVVVFLFSSSNGRTYVTQGHMETEEAVGKRLEQYEKDYPQTVAKIQQDAKEFFEIVRKLDAYRENSGEEKEKRYKDLIEAIKQIADADKGKAFQNLATGDLVPRDEMKIWWDLSQNYKYPNPLSAANGDVRLGCYNRVLKLAEERIPVEEFGQDNVIIQALFRRALHYSLSADPRAAKVELEKWFEVIKSIDPSKIDKSMMKWMEMNLEGAGKMAQLVSDFERLSESKQRNKYDQWKKEWIKPNPDILLGLAVAPDLKTGDTRMHIVEVQPNYPADSAGLKLGDVFVQLAGRDIPTLRDFASALNNMKADVSYPYTVRRNEKEVKGQIKPIQRPPEEKIDERYLKEVPFEIWRESRMGSKERFELFPGTSYIPFVQETNERP